MCIVCMLCGMICMWDGTCAWIMPGITEGTSRARPLLPE
uniref:Uncharacterized protein n=1 Tax=Setaria viridis TaxID=4556 RepID=A0A4U6VKW4_SETVI|nr:hypothetical protein SEVIR_3G321703v2 [Setaria viridis]